ncbi:TPA_asm: hypothetical protein HUJ06_019180 [Nelumbo nucifera]|uniref:Apple domain-containing protein n=1 Tax=Nelumbo nucifera TaxID=4432 RepID=A0A823A432_NELNU|nr:TPA_asm: hypothetical protein HUJ06_019180 [Nelumbo nucifera]
MRDPFLHVHVPPAECYTWNALSHNWQLFLSVPRDYCDSYGLCGAYSDCDINESPVFQCLKGFKPKSPTDWNLWIGSGDKGEGFVKFTRIKLPDTRYTWVDKNINLKDCEVECLKNCSCTTYANSDISGGSGCAIWFGDLIDIRRFSNSGSGQDLYVRMATSELQNKICITSSTPIESSKPLSWLSRSNTWRCRWLLEGIEVSAKPSPPLLTKNNSSLPTKESSRS